jgi:hypothetical protein
MLTVSAKGTNERQRAGASNRADAWRLCQEVLAGAPAGARTLVIDLEGDSCRCVFAMGASPVALWTLELRELGRTLAALPPALTADDARRVLMAQAFRLVSAARLLVLRGAIAELVTVRRKGARGAHLGRVVTAVMLRTLQLELEIPQARIAVGVAATAPPSSLASWRGDAESRTA